MKEFCIKQNLSSGYIITRELSDLGTLDLAPNLNVLKIPAALACYWLGRSEVERQSHD